MGECSWIHIFYWWVRVVGVIFWVCGQSGLFLLVGGIYLGEGIFLVGVDGSFFISGWGWVMAYFGWVGVNGYFLWVGVRAGGEGEGLFWESGGAWTTSFMSQ